ncbi:hypothetical protein [Sinomonas gamaensis]|uniref:hypothetical protein n=1 Tax=Sinomonas gamaensis TaxID=2565624 RepID=UPI0011095F58|nr:hypothetical protein [Sinomonas gamaensis]
MVRVSGTIRPLQTEQIEAQGETYDEAKEALEAQVPEGWQRAKRGLPLGRAARRRIRYTAQHRVTGPIPTERILGELREER